MAIAKPIKYILPIIVLVLLVLWQFGPEGILEEIKDTVGGMVEWGFNVSKGAKELKVEEPTIPPRHEEAMGNLLDTIKLMLDSSNENCFMKYDGLPDLGEKGTSFIFKLSDDRKKTKVIVVGGEQEVLKLYQEIPRLKPCVIAGKTPSDKNVAEDFYNNFLSENPEKGGMYYKTVNQIRIFSDGENRIEQDYGKNDLEDGGWLFKAEDGIVCFFPTYDGDPFGICDSDETGLDDDCLPKLNDLVGKKLDYCTAEKVTKIIVKYEYDQNIYTEKFYYNRNTNQWEFERPIGTFDSFNKIELDLKDKNEEQGVQYFKESILPDPGSLVSVEGIPE